MEDKLDKTLQFDKNELKEEKVRSILKHVDKSLSEKDYDSLNQIVGYLISNDPAYISSYNDARKRMLEVSRDEIIEELVKSYLKK